MINNNIMSVGQNIENIKHWKLFKLQIQSLF